MGYRKPGQNHLKVSCSLPLLPLANGDENSVRGEEDTLSCQHVFSWHPEIFKKPGSLLVSGPSRRTLTCPPQGLNAPLKIAVPLY
ncbi:hypothetical protein AQUSIP_16000 [Aquicella siphonis]|uniref:Uncharacterized protein n=1 Tax=Aquicella siphonis TaxID=254247 RepID=A0A5E4PIW4_9COXI|nr:hypothetical protein AQUSIP_16000 [Aquicella siphonis]